MVITADEFLTIREYIRRNKINKRGEFEINFGDNKGDYIVIVQRWSSSDVDTWTVTDYYHRKVHIINLKNKTAFSNKETRVRNPDDWSDQRFDLRLKRFTVENEYIFILCGENIHIEKPVFSPIFVGGAEKEIDIRKTIDTLLAEESKKKITVPVVYDGKIEHLQTWPVKKKEEWHNNYVILTIDREMKEKNVYKKISETRYRITEDTWEIIVDHWKVFKFSSPMTKNLNV